MINLIYKVFIIQIVLNYEAYAREIHMTNISEVIGTNDIKLKCSYTTDPNDRVSGVTFLAVNDTTDKFVDIAESTVFSSQPEILAYGVYLFGSANITKLSDELSEVVLTFNDLKCKHERSYRCMLSVHNTSPTNSTPMQLFVQVPPMKPDTIEQMKAPMDVLTTAETARVETTSSPVTKSVNISTLSEITTPTAITSLRSNSSTTTLLLKFTTLKVENNITATTNTYNNSTSSTEPTPDSPYIMEGDNITVKCSGNVGKPAGIFTFLKFHKDSIGSTTYNATTTKIDKIPGNCSYYRTSYLTFQITADDNQAVIQCAVVSPLAAEDMFIDLEQLEVKSDKSTTKSTSTSSSSGAVDTTGDSSKNLAPVFGGVGGGVVGVLLIVIISYCVYTRRKKTSKIPSNKNEFEGSVDSKLKPIAESRTGNYDYIALEDDASKTNSSNNGLEVEDINKHNAEYLKKQEEEEKKKNESNTPPQPAVYAQVDEASKLKNKQKSETLEMPDKQEEDPYAETQEGVYDETGNPRYKENKNAEQFDVSTNSSKQNSNGDNKLSIQTSQVGSYANQGFEKDENRKVATVSPTVRSSSGSQNDEQTNSNRNSQSKKGYENIIGTDQTGISEEESSHRTAL